MNWHEVVKALASEAERTYKESLETKPPADATENTLVLFSILASLRVSEANILRAIAMALNKGLKQ